MRARLYAVLAFGLLSACGGTSPAVMEFVEISPPQPRIGDVTTIRFRLLDERGIPLAGARVDFKLSSANSGVSLSPTSTVSIRGSGYAETQIIANSRVNSVIVIATSGDKQVVSPPITFAGTTPSGDQLSFGCGPIAGEGSGGRHALGAFDGTRTLIVGSAIDCAAHVGDRNGDGVVDALVSFMTEAGTIGPSEISVSNLVGDAVVTYKTSEPLPVATDPGTFTWNPTGKDGSEPEFTGEYLAPLWMHPFNWSEDPRVTGIALANSGTVPTYNLNEPRRPDPIRIGPDGQHPINNPRDNLVSMLAVTSGEEGFDDLNNNGVYDANESFRDLTEPFVDSNDDGTHQDAERYIDTNGNGQWDGKNGRWDGNTLIWKQERILWTGYFINEDVLGVPGVPGQKTVVNLLGSGGTTVDLKCPVGVGTDCTKAVSQKAYAYIADPWFNSIARNGDADGCEVSASDMQPVRVISDTGRGFAFTYPAGEVLGFVITDTRDPDAPPIDQIRKRSPPAAFNANVGCVYTSSPKDGYELKISAGVLRGTTE